MQDFSGLPETLTTTLAAKGYLEPTPVQVAVTQPDLAGLDLLVSAQTGSGKTVGFGLALAQDLLDTDGRFARPAAPLALIIAPTRELAMQVQREFDWLFAEAGIMTASAVGGMDARTERRAIERGAHVIVATPGRLRDHVSRGVIDLGDVKAVVLDEADEMLDMGFSEDLEFILDHTSDSRRTLLFSATVPRGIAKLAQTYQKEDARRIEVGDKDAQHADIAYLALTVAPSDIEKAIINLLRYHDAQTAIVFANTRSMVARLTAKFSNRGFSVVALSGELSQSERTHALQALRDGRARVCIATDVAARGIDLPGLELVIHADLPSNAESLLHRSGRTGRAGRKGTSVLIVPGRQRSKAQRLLRSANLDAEWGTPPSAEMVLARDEDRLMSDPSWERPLSPEEQSFAERLLDVHSAEKIAAAYLRLYRDRNSAPEILGDIPEPGARKTREPAAFGPSTWFSLSLGRKQRAEPRWLLPMLCRNAGLSKDSIGAIRVQYQETFIEILTAAVPAMKTELGPELEIEQGARLTELPGMPDLDASPKGPPATPKSPPKAPHQKRESHTSSPGRGHAGEPEPAGSVQAEPHKGKPDAPQDGPGKHKAKRPKRTKPDHAQAKSAGTREKRPYGKGTGQDHKKRKNAADPSKPLGPRREREKGRPDSDKPKRIKTRAAKGPDARPMRKPSPKP
ncbi:ATP-dependent RNA helicase DeaD [Rhodovulum bhavnagarense]|uniref:ATP-dependent RNA helicase DeaD n=1 Tax=Rhodovulum bhavnagarense TaxID=992286 RepID=A0A4R2RGF3_9RHOB|nr:DEAD/DEAH box helicase [Rhodovulum bhavnagarense]TCP61167.1 ATP-dependent RNA helicase DeaD [Rhodovulum bhavnagarense]